MLIVVMWLMGCGASEPEKPPMSSTELKGHMQGHLRDVDAIRKALVVTDLEGAKKANRVFLDHKVAYDLPGDWVTHVAAMGDAALALDASADVAAASTHAAELAHACGACHVAVNAEVQTTRLSPGADHAAKESHRLEKRWDALVSGRRAPRADVAAAQLTECALCHMNGDPLPEGGLR